MTLNEGLKSIFLAGVGAVAVTAEKSKEIIDELVKKGELTVEQGKVLNEELKRNIKEKVKETVTVQVVEELKKYFPQKIYRTVIPRNVRLSEAPSFGQPVMYYDRASKGCAAYEQLTQEFLEKNKR